MTQVSEYKCKKAISEKVRGFLSDWVELRRNSGEDISTEFTTKARLSWDEKFLYVQFSCLDDTFNATLTDYNDKLYTEDVVEVFIDDNCDLKTYTEIEVNPLNAVLHYHVLNNLHNNFWGYAKVEQSINSKVEIVKHPDGIEWQVSISIPMEEFVTAKNCPPKEGDVWLFNLYRIKTYQSGDVEYSSFSATKVNSFHRPDCFAKLIFK